MNKQIIVIIVVLAVGAILFTSGLSFDKGVVINSSERDLSFSLPSFSLPTLNLILIPNSPVAREAWTVFQNYLEFARTHNLAGIRSLSHQISATCNDPSKATECFALMDSVYAFASGYTLNEFRHVLSDERQIIMFTDGPTVAILYFTRAETNTIKVLGMRFCFEDEATVGSCVETDSVKLDENGNGWWDSVESFFID